MKGKLSLVALALASLLAGCAAPGATVDPQATAGGLEPLTEDVFGFGAFLAEKVPAPDGVALHVDVQLPNGEGPFPVIVEYTPYSNNLNVDYEAWGFTRGLGRAEVAYDVAEFYVPKGYAVAIAHVRGTGQSGGCFTVGGPEEAQDGYAIVEWLAEQPWSNGKVALMGTSYPGSTPIATANLDPPHLTTIVPTSSVTEWYKYYFENGEPRFFGELPTGFVYFDHPIWMGLGFIPKPRNPAGVDPSQPECALAQGQNAYLQDDDNDYWRARNYVKGVANATAPMLYAQGFLDENTPTSLVPEFFNAYPGVKRAWLQQHGHGVPARFEAYHEHVHRWLDHFLLGRDNGALDAPSVIVQDNRGQYHTFDEWPSREAKPFALHLGPGTLTPDAPAEGSASYTDEPRGMNDTAKLGLPREGSFLEFATEPLAEPLHVSGVPVMMLSAASSATDTQWDVLLLDEAEDGVRKLLTRGYLDARHRDGNAQAADVVPGEEVLYQWPLHARDHHVAAGHRLVLVLSSSDVYVVPDAPGAVNTVFFGEGKSRVELPVLDLTTRTFLDEAPTIPSP